MLKINPQVATSYVENNHTCRGSGMGVLRIRECPLCHSEKWNVSFKQETQVLTSFCCDANLGIIDLVKRDQGIKTTRQAMQFLNGYGNTSIVWDKDNQFKGDENVKLKSIRERMEQKETKFFNSPIDVDHLSWDWTTTTGKNLMEYARKRNVPEWFIESGRMCYFIRGALVGRLCFLTIENDVPVFAVGRSVDGREPKYLALSSMVIGENFGSSDFVFNLDLIEQGEAIIVHEGVLSALSGGPGSVATFGKGISEVQMHKIARKKPEVVILLVEDGVPEHRLHAVGRELNSMGVFTLVAPLIDGDANDNPEQMPEVIGKAVPVSRLSHLRARIRKP